MENDVNGPLVTQWRKLKISPLILQTMRRNLANLPVAGVPTTGDRLVNVFGASESVCASRKQSPSQLTNILIQPWTLFASIGRHVSALRRLYGQAHL